MEGLLFPFAAAVMLLPIAWMTVPPAVSAWRRRHETRPAFKPRPGEKLVVPSADETAAAVERFHRAVRHSDLSDYLGS
jgi:hypothetical protein